MLALTKMEEESEENERSILKIILTLDCIKRERERDHSKERPRERGREKRIIVSPLFCFAGRKREKGTKVVGILLLIR